MRSLLVCFLSLWGSEGTTVFELLFRQAEDDLLVDRGIVIVLSAQDLLRIGIVSVLGDL